MLNREPMGMKPSVKVHNFTSYVVSVLNREPMGMKQENREMITIHSNEVSVLNREPMGMKLKLRTLLLYAVWGFSAQPRADGDEAPQQHRVATSDLVFQCSTASRWG